MDKLNVPQRYIPKILTRKDKKKQEKSLRKSRKLYKKKIYFSRPKVKSFKSRKSNHLRRARELYNIENVTPNEELAKKTKCSIEGLKKIVNKGRGAYYSSGSRPNQTAESWGLARLSSSLTGGNASIVDYHILKLHCKSSSKAIKLAKNACTQKNRKCE